MRVQALEEEDALAEIMAERSRRCPDFPALVEAHAHARRLLRSLVDKRKALQLTQATLARRMETSPTAIARLEAGYVNPRLTTLQRYAVALGLQIEWRVVERRSPPASADTIMVDTPDQDADVGSAEGDVRAAATAGIGTAER